MEEEGRVQLQDLHDGVRHHDHDADARKGDAPPQTVGDEHGQAALGGVPHPPHKDRHEQQADDEEGDHGRRPDGAPVLGQLHQHKGQHGKGGRLDDGAGPVHLRADALPGRADQQAVGGQQEQADGEAEGDGGGGKVPGRPPADGLDEDAAEDQAGGEAEGLAETGAGKGKVSQAAGRDGVAEYADRGGETHCHGDALHGPEHGQLDVGAGQAAAQGEAAEQKGAEQEDTLATDDVGQGAGHD